ncbi:MAG: L-seryl-tRNA(Sec) selenium transferase, partial [Anaerobacillus sp.]
MKLLRELPPIHQILEELMNQEIGKDLPNDKLKQMIQQEMNALRDGLLNNSYSGSSRSRVEFQAEVIEKVQSKAWLSYKLTLRPLVNATGVVLHTNLGRARLSEEAISHMVDVARSYSTLEYDLD